MPKNSTNPVAFKRQTVVEAPMGRNAILVLSRRKDFPAFGSALKPENTGPASPTTPSRRRANPILTLC